jgi:serine/tyrosine/threonine adenylyltransferase
MANLTMATTYESIAAVAAFRFDNSFARELQGFYVPQQPAVVRAPRLLFLNDSLAAELGLDLNSETAARFFSAR